MILNMLMLLDPMLDIINKEKYLKDNHKKIYLHSHPIKVIILVDVWIYVRIYINKKIKSRRYWSKRCNNL
jgi:hypothetical protein